jgi:hypothetical protein
MGNTVSFECQNCFNYTKIKTKQIKDPEYANSINMGQKICKKCYYLPKDEKKRINLIGKEKKIKKLEEYEENLLFLKKRDQYINCNTVGGYPIF